MMLFLLLTAALLSFSAFAISLDKLASQGKFTLEQTVQKRPIVHSASRALEHTYLKYGLPPPDFSESLRALTAGEQGTIAAVPSANDQQYLIKAQVGNHNMTLDLDTGSSDLWVVSTLLPSAKRGSRPPSKIYDTQGPKAKILTGSTWSIVYGDGSSAGGQVFIDQVTIGGLRVADQAVQAASKISNAFLYDGRKDGFLGLGFPKGNTVRPKKQATWFENVRPKLAKPLFTSSLKRHAPGSYDFGFIDPAKYTGNITYVNLKGQRPYWDFNIDGFAFGDGTIRSAKVPAIADTGASLWYMPATIVDSYWKSVEGAVFRGNNWIFPCNAKLRDISVQITGQRITVPAINLVYMKQGGANMCLGGLQRDLPMGFSIFGDVFLKGMFVIWEAPANGQARLGFAKGR